MRMLITVNKDDLRNKRESDDLIQITMQILRLQRQHDAEILKTLLKSLGKFDKITIKLAAQLDNPHHEGAGGVDDFVDKETFQKHVKRVSSRNKRKR